MKIVSNSTPLIALSRINETHGHCRDFGPCCKEGANL